MAETEESVTAPVTEVTEVTEPQPPVTPEVLDDEDEDEFDDEFEDEDEEEDEEEEKLSDEELKEIGDRIERFVTSQIPYLRKFIVRNWNQSGQYQSALDPGRRKPLEFVNDEEKAAFIPFCEKQLYRVPLRHPAYEGETDALTCLAIDYLNGMRWESCMVMGHCYVLGPGGNGITYAKDVDTLVGRWNIDFTSAAREIRDWPLVKGGTVYY